MTVASTLTLTDSRWRLLNRLDAGPIGAAALLAEQAAPPDDLYWLATADLVGATLAGSRTRLNLADHLAHAGDTAVITLTLNVRGRRAVRAPQNRLLRRLADAGSGPLGLHILIADTGTDARTVAALGHRQLVTAAVRATGAPLTADDLELLPAATITVRLTDKGRIYLPRPAGQPALTGAVDSGGRAAVPAAVTAVFAEDGDIDAGPGSVMPVGFNGPSVEWFQGTTTGGRELRITDLNSDQDASVALSGQQIRSLCNELGHTLGVGAAGGLRTGAGSVTWQPGPDGRYEVTLTGDDGRQAVLSLTPAQMQACHRQLTADMAEEDTARATFTGLTGRLQDKPRAQRYDVDAPLTLPAGALSEQQLAASARALRLYRSGTYRAIAAHLRGDADPDETLNIRELPGEPGHDERLADHVAAIDQAFTAAPLAGPITLWRGLHDLPEHTGADLDTNPVGTTWTERSFPSTSVEPGVAAIFAGDVLLRLHVPAGVGAIQLDSRPTSREHTREAEVLLPRGLTMRVTGESEVPIGGGGVTYRDGKEHIAEPTPYRVLEVEVTMPAAPKPRRARSRSPRPRADRARTEQPGTGRGVAEPPAAVGSGSATTDEEAVVFAPASDPGRSGAGWVTGPDGQSGPWGRYGAAGVLVRHQGDDGQDRYLMVRAGAGADGAGRWQFPGGARDENETVHQTAARETHEELGVPYDDLVRMTPHGQHVYERDGWSYTTVTATTPNRFEVRQADWETSDAAWLTRAEITDLDRAGQLIEPLTGRAIDTIMDLIPNRDSGPGEAGGEPPARPVGPLPRSSEPIRPPNGGWGIDQGLMHFDGAFGRLWNQLGDDRQLQVDGHALGNLIADLGEGITLHRHDTNQALARLRRLREQLPDDRTGRLVDQAIARLDAPPRPVPPLPEQTPEPLRTLMAELNNINLVRRGGDDGFPMSSDGRHETDVLADLAHRWANGEISRGQLKSGVTGLVEMRHESMEGWTEIRDAVARALATAREWKRP